MGMKHIHIYSQVSESVGRGSIVLIKGKGSPGKLYATHVMGWAMLKPGAKMLFLSDEFYRIKREGGKLVPVRVGFKNEAALMGALNLKVPGKISIVINHNKTPFHWKTLNHTSIYSALREVEDGILLDDYLLEKDRGSLTRDEVWNLFGNYIGKKVYRTAFEETNEVDVFSYAPGLEMSRFVESIDETTSEEIDWYLNFEVFDRSREVEPYLDYFEMVQPIPCSFAFSSEVEVTVRRIPGDWDTPPDTEVDVEHADHKKVDFELEGIRIEPDPELKSMLDAILTIIKEKEMDDDDLHRLVSKKIKTPRYLKGE
jgi:hypothetical protein